MRPFRNDITSKLNPGHNGVPHVTTSFQSPCEIGLNLEPFLTRTALTVVIIRDQMRSVAKQVSVAVDWVKIKILLMAQLKGLTAKFKLM